MTVAIAIKRDCLVFFKVKDQSVDAASFWDFRFHGNNEFLLELDTPIVEASFPRYNGGIFRPKTQGVKLVETTLIYDNRGNITEEIDALGGETKPRFGLCLLLDGLRDQPVK